MAKQNSLYTFEGSVGNVVGYSQNTSSKTGAKKVVRIKATDVSNPRSQKQSVQRAKVKPARAFYDAFVSVLNHAFFPNGKAIRNKNRFLSLAMKSTAIPDVRKQDNYLQVRVPYQISEGTLGLDALCVAESPAANEQVLDFGLAYTGSAVTNTATIADISTQLLTDNTDLVEGEELTLLLVLDIAASAARYAAICSIVLDKGNTITTLADVGFPDDFQITAASGKMRLSPTGTDILLNAAGLIISSKTSSSWRYTNSFMCPTLYGLDGIVDEAEVVESYMNAAVTSTSDLILQQADNLTYDGTVTPQGLLQVPVTLKEGAVGTLPTNSHAAVVHMTNGSRYVVVNDDYIVMFRNGTTWQQLQTTQLRRVPITDTNLAAEPIINLNTVKLYF